MSSELLMSCKEAKKSGRDVVGNELKALKKSEEVMYKINFNGAVSESKEAMGLGWIVKDHNGDLIVAGARRVTGQSNTKLAETLGALDAAGFARSKNFTRLTVEGDCQSLINKINDNKEDWSTNEVLVMDI